MADRYLSHPFRFGTQGDVAVTGDTDRHLRDKVEAVLFTSPGERVNQPDFGAGLNHFVFEGLNDLTVAALEFRVSQALRRDLGDEIVIDAVSIDADPYSGELILHLAFRRRSDQRSRNLEIKL